MRRDPHTGRSGASLVEVLVATLLFAIGTLIWLGAFHRSIRLLDEAHLGLHAAIMMTEVANTGQAAALSRPVGPGRMEATRDVGSIQVVYEPPAGSEASAVYGREHSWTLEP